MSKTTVITDTTQLSAIADAILLRANAGPLSKNTILNIVAAQICGPKHNWGFMTSRRDTIVGRGLSQTEYPPTPSEPAGKTGALLDIGQGFSWHPELGGRIGLTTHDGGQQYEAPISATDLLILRKALVLGKTRFGLEGFLVEIAGSEIAFFQNSLSGTAWMRMKSKDFMTYLDAISEALITQCLAEKAGDAVHHAFCSLCESSLADRDLGSKDLDAACRYATIGFVEKAATDHDIYQALKGGDHRVLADLVFDSHWTLLYQYLPSEE